MTPERAIEIVKLFQDWRTGKIHDYPVQPREITEALTIVLQLAEGGREIINYIEQDAEVIIPIEEFFNEDKSHITKNQYGKVVIKYLCNELRDKFPKLAEENLKSKKK